MKGESAQEQGGMDPGGTDHGSSGDGHQHHDHSMMMKDLPKPQAIAWIAGTYVVLFAAVWLTNFVVPVRF